MALRDIQDAVSLGAGSLATTQLREYRISIQLMTKRRRRYVDLSRLGDRNSTVIIVVDPITDTMPLVIVNASTAITLYSLYTIDIVAGLDFVTTWYCCDMTEPKHLMGAFYCD